MGAWWRESLEVFAGLLREHGQDHAHVSDGESAWQAFSSFLACPVDGLEPGPDTDADGFILQWGRYGWNNTQPSLTFTRQFAVDVRATWTEQDWYQPEYWKVELDLIFNDEPALAGIDQSGSGNTGFDFSPPVTALQRALRDAEQKVRNYPALRTLWESIPARSSLHLHSAD
jgi:hypothetical protein